MKLSNGVPTFDETMLPLLRVAANGPLTRAEAAERVADAMQLTPEQRAALMPKGHTIIRDRIGWARTYLVQAGLLRAVKRGVFEITEEGRELLKRPPPKIDFDFLMAYPAFRAFHERSVQSHRRGGSNATEPAEETDPAQATPEERIDGALNEIDVALREALLQRVRSGTPAFFERLVIELLVRMGYGGSREDAAKHLGGPGDGGVDGVIKLDKLGLDVVYIQAKRNAENNGVSRPIVQAFAGALDGQGATRGVFITTSYFSDEALSFVRTIRSKQIVLIDGDELAELLIAYDVGVREDRQVTIKKLDEDFFEE
jgi:restriction system protein